MKRYKIYVLLILIAGFSSCRNTDSDFDASGTFETTEVIVSAEAAGKIMTFNLTEGQQLNENEIAGYIDSTQLHLKKQQLLSSINALLSRRPDLKKQLGTLEQQLITARNEKKRVESLLKSNAATTKQLDDLNAQIAVLERQLAATKSTLESSLQSISGEKEALEIQALQLEDQLQKCNITSPISGTVLVKYAEKGELAAPGKALFKIGDTNNMIFRAYITADQLTQVKADQQVQIFADFGKDEYKSYDGTITWISSKSEFTPKTIQTRDERANLVYAVKVKVKNDGYLKIGQYGFLKIK
ncbi:MAG: HlyD family efflux transporter periplasmic adaptor subunit [Paludibacter sp.]|nr:HlyD family efflux transporter periplasmic adaptor subunit [Paludibacter sp.]